MDEAQLAEELDKAKAELFNLRFQIATGSGADNGRVRALR
ncbi:50S ribosomal protein L29, partial [Aerococcus sp. UMB8623]